MGTRFGGRARGVANSDTQKFVHLLQTEGFDPALALIRVAQGDIEALGVPEIEFQFRVRAMEILIQYLLPKRKAIEVKAEVTNRNSVLMVPAPMSAKEWEDMVAAQMKAVQQEPSAVIEAEGGTSE
jgi:hypothetical protein